MSSLHWTVLPAPEPIGALTVGATADGLALVVFGEDPTAPARAAERLGTTAARVEPAALDAARELREYLAGGRRVFDVPLDWGLTAGSQRRVLEALHAHVPYGATTTYGELATLARLGPGHTAARGVGAIMGSNPLPVVVPCHRVLAAGGRGPGGYELGGFGGGRRTKEWLLALEGVLTPALDFGPE